MLRSLTQSKKLYDESDRSNLIKAAVRSKICSGEEVTFAQVAERTIARGCRPRALTGYGGSNPSLRSEIKSVVQDSSICYHNLEEL